jgi:molybdopterin-guanine dinucleotide biosynthesis protein A
VSAIANAASTRRVIAGVFVGGAGKRMGGGCAKGLLAAPGGGTLLERWRRLLHTVGVDRLVLVGENEAYIALGLEAIGDEPRGIGPIGGLAALLERAGHGHALALACDMPFVSGALVTRLLSAAGAPVVAPKRGLWEPLCARYDAQRVLPIVRQRIAAGRHSLQGLLDEAGTFELPLYPEDAGALHDWDTPEDLHRGAFS